MKLCYTCRQEKDAAEFNKNKSKRDGLNSICKICSRARSKQYYREHGPKHREVVIARRAQYLAQSRQLIWNYLSLHPCVDCGETDPVVLEFDHIKDKLANVSHAMHWGWSEKRLFSEIEKCEIRCANCHRRKTSKQDGWWYENYAAVAQRQAHQTFNL